MTVLLLVALICFVIGVYAASRWLPPLGAGPVGAIAYFVVVGLSGAAFGLVGINVDQTVRGLERSDSGALEDLVVANGLANIMRDAGSVVALALIAYLLAPK